MDQVKIGQFIATCRKEQGLTQAQLAEQNLVEVQEKKEKADKAMSRIMIVWLVLSIAGFIFHMAMNYFDIETGGIEGMLVLLIGFGLMFYYFRKYYEIRLK